MNDPQWLNSTWAAISSQVTVDKVYIETYRSRVIADDATIDAAKKFFLDHGVQVAGGICYSDADHGQFTSFVYTRPADRDYVKHVSELTAKHFDEIILDDFFFANTKADSDIAAKGNLSWTDFRVKTMDEVSRDLVVNPARAVNPKVKIIIKYPNWYEHFQANGYDLADQPAIFDGIYAGTETRDPVDTDQNLQPYESFSIVRYFEHIAPNRMGGGWVDVYGVHDVDRYSEQLWLTVFAKAHEMTLFNYMDLIPPAKPGNRPWSSFPTDVNWDKIVKRANGKPTYASIAGDALDQVKPFIDKLGTPIGIASYRPPHATGEDFLHNFLGMIGIPIDLYPTFPANANTILLTESAKSDPNVIPSMKAALQAGKTVIITSGLLQALQGHGIDDLIELRTTGMHASITNFYGAFGSGSGNNLGTASSPILFPEIRFYTNDAWPVIRGTANGNGFPILLMDGYSKGKLFVLTIPDNFTDLYNLPEPALNALRSYVLEAFPVRMNAPARVALFPYDNHTFIVESFRDTPCEVSLLLPENATLTNLVSNQEIKAQAPAAVPAHLFVPAPPPHSTFTVTLQPHSYLVFSTH